MAGEMASLHQQREHHVQDHHRLALAGRGERPVKRVPGGIGAQVLAAAPRAPR